MAEATPARISYTFANVTREIDFHAVVSESHDATGTVTKFPVQAGFEISNHSIRRNRKIIVEAMVTNTPLDRSNYSSRSTFSNTQEVFSTDMPKNRFSELEFIVLNSIPCDVFSNLGEYSPVVFTNFQTKQMQGLTDAILFTITGEEVQVRSSLDKAGIVNQAWIDLNQAEKDALFNDIEKNGMPRPNKDFEAQKVSIYGDTGASVVVPDGVGETRLSIVPVLQGEGTQSLTALMESDTPLVNVAGGAEESAFNIFTLAGDLVPKSTSKCIRTSVSGILERETTSAVSTVLGNWQRTARGYLYDVLKIEDDSPLNVLKAVVTDCLLITSREELTNRGLPQEVIDVIPKRGVNRVGNLPAATDYINQARLGGYKRSDNSIKRKVLDIYRVYDPLKVNLGSFGDLNG